ncbi:MAG: PAS domain S-box protein, partial [Planctomycetes bacterium]|nr:PAS domain S-box protein [Planctomycetota bacterium]
MSMPARLLRAVAGVLPGGARLRRRLDAACAYDDLVVATDRAGVGLAWVDAQGRVQRGNRAASGIWGVAPENIAGLSIGDLMQIPVADLIQRRDPEMVTIHRAGQRRTIAVEATRVQPAGDDVVALLVIEDVTERVRSQELLQHQKHVLELMARSLPLNDILAGIVRLIEDQAPGALSTIYLVDAQRRLRLGAAPSWPAEFVTAVDGCAIGPEAGSCGAAAYFAKRMVSTDIAAGGDPCWGSYREWILSYGIRAAWSTPVLGKDGIVLGTVSMCWREPRVPTARELELVDVATRLMAMAIERAQGEAVATEQRARLLAAACIEEHWRLLSAVLHSTSDGILVSDGQDRVTICNRALSTMWRSEEAVAVGIDVQRFLQVVAVQVDQDGLPRLQAAARIAQSQPFVLELRDGRAFDCCVRPLQLAADGAPAGRVWTFRDISERRRLEAQLHFSERMASIGRLAAGVAHEINNPMTHVLCALDLARQRVEAPDAGHRAVVTLAATLADVAALIRDAHGSGLRVGRIVSELKNFSRNDGDDLAPLRVEDALEAAIGIANSQLQHRARLERRYAATPLAVGNENRLAQVFLNILINAVQALPDRPIDENRIEIVTGRDPDG